MWLKLRIIALNVSQIISDKTWAESRREPRVEYGHENWVESSQKPWVKSIQENLNLIPSKNWVKLSWNRWIAQNCWCQWWVSQRPIRLGNGWDLGVAADCLMFVTIVVPCRTVDVTIDVEVGRAVLGRISCNRSVKRFPGDVIRTNGLANEGVQVIWYRR